MDNQQRKLQNILTDIASKPNNSKYDVMIPVSGGKDGTYLLWYLKKNTDLRILAFHYNNWFISPETKQNLTNTLKKIGCDYVEYQPDWKKSKEIYRKLLLGMGEICIACEMILNISVFDFAVSNQIPCVAWALTGSQMSKKNIPAPIFKTDYQYYNDIVEYYKTLVESLYSDDRSKAGQVFDCFVSDRVIHRHSDFPEFFYPFSLLEYDAKEIEKQVSEAIGWKRPADTGGASSNCLINQLHIQLKKNLRGRDFYINALTKKRELNEVTQEVLENAVNDSGNETLMKALLDELDISDSIDGIVASVKGFKKNAFLRSQSNISI